MEAEILPTKMVATVKPPGKRKGRIVVCGNYAGDKAEDTSVGGICAVALRGAVHKAAAEGWSMATVDVKGAFLQAPRRTKEKVSLVQPPGLLIQMGLAEPGEVWQVHQALYGYVESPADWGHFRDNEGLRKMEWEMDGVVYKLAATPEPHLWKIKKGDSTEGLVLVYVDDFLITAPESIKDAVLNAISKTWECSPPEQITAKEWVRYCGYEIKAKAEGGFMVRQTNYIQDIVDRRKIQGEEAVPLPKIEDDDDEVNPDIGTIREAQGLVGELMWISGRSRPDLGYGVSFLSRMIHRRPGYVCKLAQHMLKFLNKSKEQALHFRKLQPGKEEEMSAWVDASFAPPHEGFRSVQGVALGHGGNIVMWHSMRQPFITASTAEAELIGYAEAHQEGRSFLALLETLELKVSKAVMYGDNRAALILCNQDTGPWRTRRLRLRAACLREELQKPNPLWKAEYLAGTELLADGLTKPLQGQSFGRFQEMLGLAKEEDIQVKKMKIADRAESGRDVEAAAGCLTLAGYALRLKGNPLGQLLLMIAVLLKCYGGQKRTQEREELTREGGTATSAEDGKPSRSSGGATPKDGGPSRFSGGATTPAQDGEWTRLGAPGIRAFRVRVESDSHGDQRPVAPAASVERRTSATGSTSAAGSPELSTAANRGRAILAAVAVENGNISISASVDDRETLQAGNEGYVGRSPDYLLPWEQQAYRTPGKGADRWVLDLWDEGWLIRLHPKSRKQDCRPGQCSSLPCRLDQLTGRRITLIYDVARPVPARLTEDNFLEVKGWTRESEWTGVTFLQRRPTYSGPEGASRVS